MHSNNANPWWKKLGWLLLIWACSVGVLVVVAWLMRIVMNAVGLSS